MEPSPFLRLPPELRNRIYENLFSMDQGKPRTFNLEKDHTQHPVLCVNRQLRRECESFFYANTIFYFTDPRVAVRHLTNIPLKCVDLIPELRYDTSEACAKVTSWRTAFRELPGLDEDAKLESLRKDLATHGIVLKADVLKAKIMISCQLDWTSDPLASALDAVRQGLMVGRMMFI